MCVCEREREKEREREEDKYVAFALIKHKYVIIQNYLSIEENCRSRLAGIWITQMQLHNSVEGQINPQFCNFNFVLFKL